MQTSSEGPGAGRGCQCPFSPGSMGDCSRISIITFHLQASEAMVKVFWVMYTALIQEGFIGRCRPEFAGRQPGRLRPWPSTQAHPIAERPPHWATGHATPLHSPHLTVKLLSQMCTASTCQEHVRVGVCVNVRVCKYVCVCVQILRLPEQPCVWPVPEGLEEGWELQFMVRGAMLNQRLGWLH